NYVAVSVSANQKGPQGDILIYLPAEAQNPVPVILPLNFPGNQAVINEPAIKLATVWSRDTHEPQQAKAESRGSDPGFEVEKVLARGYGFATIYYQDIEPDFSGEFAHGVRPLLLTKDQYKPAADNW